ncbi:MAG: Acyl-[acyl-carrier-protein]--UDP-N-acetylglucosamine O-acyltransferase [Calditrichaeota bacterium]|nr:Acyl-[acyl-carrier-protein]--UDP-N-acetylglucosamine O-acyltransferase [Calditrichota bacterium]
MSVIDRHADVDPGAELGDDVTVGPFAVIEAGAVLGHGCRVGPHAYVTKWARLGNDVQVHNGAVVGSDPQDLKFEGEETTLAVGDRTVIREFATLNRGTNESGSSSVGADCLLMAYTHVAHDCHLGDHVILANSVNMGGHVYIGDWAIVGGLVPIHQFVHIGCHCFIGGGWRVPQDVPPYMLAAGSPLSYRGLNSIGLRRRGFSSENIIALKRAYKLIYRSNLNLTQAVERIHSELEMTSEIGELLRFIEQDSKRGIIGRGGVESDF